MAVSGSATFTVTPVTDLSAGTYTATVTASGDNVASQEFTVSFTVNPAASEGEVTISFNSNGGDTEASPASATVESGGTAALPGTNPTRAGYTFGGWNTAADGTGTAFTASTAVTGDITVYALWYENLTGSGSDADPYVIGTAEQLRSMAFFVNNYNAQYGDKYYRQTADIDLGALWTETGGGADATLIGGRAWTPIGNGTGSLYSIFFTGTFDGGGHAISGLYINGGQYVGLFGSAFGAVIKNVGVVDSYVKGGSSPVGGVVGCLGTYINTTTYIAEYSTISNCCNEGTTVVSLGAEGSASHAGGVVGALSGGCVVGCYNTGRVIARSSGGGVAALASQNTRLENCYNAGQVSSSVRGGGLVGSFDGGELANCYNSGVVSAGSYTGAIAGEVGVAGIVLTNVYYLEGSAAAAFGRISGSGSGAAGGVYVTEAELSSGEICYLLQSGQSRQVWGQTAVGGTNFPRLAYEGEDVKEAVRVRFYDDTAVAGSFALDFTRYTVAGGTVDFPAIADVTWLDGAGAAYTESSPFSADTDLYTSRAGSVPVVVTGSLPDGTTGESYSAALSATGGGTITWTKLGALPDGLTLSADGLISGTPTAAGTFSVSFQAENTYGSSAVKTLTITINDPPAPVPQYGVSLDQSGTYTFPDYIPGGGSYSWPTLVVTISNAGTQATGDLSVALSGDGAGFFVLSTDGIGSLYRDTATFSIMLSGDTTVGTHRATVTVSNSDHGISASFDVSFTVAPAAAYSVSLSQTDTYTFDGQDAGYSIGSITPLTVTLTNTGTRETGALTATAGSSFAVSRTNISSIAVGGSTAFTVRPVNNLGAGTYTGTVTVSGSNGITASFDVSFTVSTPAAGIVSTVPASLTEAAANDGSLVSGTVVITIANGTLASDIAKADVTASNLPAGLDYSVTRDSSTQLTVTISGNAASHADVDDVSNLTFTIAQAKVTGAAGNLTTENISIDFNDPVPVTVTSVTVNTPPTKTIYTAGDALDLTGLVVTLHKSDSTTQDVAFADFSTNGITTSPANGAELSTSNTSVTISHTESGQTTSQSITVNAAPVVSATISPDTGGFDKYAPADVQTAITWGNAISVSDVKAGSTSIGADNYNVSGNTLTIKKEYLSTQSTGSFVLMVEFNEGEAATLTITISDTTPPTISPTTRNFDLSAPADVTTIITWNSAASVTDAVYSISPDVTVYTLTMGDDYTVSGNTFTVESTFFTAASVTAGDALAFTITFNTGTTVPFMVNVVDSYVPSGNADLSSLSVNGTPVSGFDPAVITYNVTLPYGASGATVTAAVYDPLASLDITQASALPGSATVTVTAEDGTTKTYTINLTVGAAPIVSVTGITVTGEGGATGVQVGHTLQMLADVSPANATDDSVTWSIESRSGATISTSGLLTATAEGSVTVRATANDGSAVYGERIVTITAASPTFVAVTNITGVPTAAVAGTPLTLTSVVTPAGATNRTIVWSVQNAGATGATVSGNTLSTTAAGTVIVRATIVNGLTESTNYTQDFTITVTSAPVTSYTVTFNNNGSVYATKTVNAGQSIGSGNFPANPTRSGYTFGGWFTGENGAGTLFAAATPVNATMTVYAKWTVVTDNGGGGGGGSSTPTSPEYKADVDTDSGSSISLPVTVDTDSGSASVELGAGNLEQGGDVTVTIPSIPGVSDYTVGIPVPDLSTEAPQGTLTLDTVNGNVTVPSNMLTGVLGISRSKAEISIGQGDKDTLPDDVKAAIGDKPLISLTLEIDGKQTDWSNPNAPVTVSIPYTPTSAELANPESIIIWYIDGSGNVVTIPNGHYDATTGTVTFQTTHFSDYAVAYNKVSFRCGGERVVCQGRELHRGS